MMVLCTVRHISQATSPTLNPPLRCPNPSRRPPRPTPPHPSSTPNPCSLDLVTQSPTLRRCLAALLLREAAAAGASPATSGKSLQAKSILGEWASPYSGIK